MKNYEQLVADTKEYGFCPVPRRFVSRSGFKLGRRSQYRDARDARDGGAGGLAGLGLERDGLEANLRVTILLALAPRWCRVMHATRGTRWRPEPRARRSREANRKCLGHQ